MKKIYWTALFLVSFASIGCGDEIERTYDCAKICDAYADCYDEDLDKVACVDECEDKGDEDEDFEEQASACEECIGSESCASATVSCTDECAWIVAQSTD